jgi:hypothetical protein
MGLVGGLVDVIEIVGTRELSLLLVLLNCFLKPPSRPPSCVPLAMALAVPVEAGVEISELKLLVMVGRDESGAPPGCKSQVATPALTYFSFSMFVPAP